MIIAPIRTEKAISKMEFENTLTFAISDNATSRDVKAEVEKMLGVKVVDVRTYHTLRNGKRAVVKLLKGTNMDEIAAKLKLI